MNEDKKNQCKKLYELANNLLGLSFTDSSIQESLILKKDRELFFYFSQIISFQNYLEKILSIKNNHLSLKYAQILSNISDKSLSLDDYEDIDLKKILIDINFLKTYIRNVYGIQKKYFDKHFDPINITSLQTVLEKKRKSIIQNETLKAQTISPSRESKVPELMRPSFFPYSKKNKLIIGFKYLICSLLGLLSIIEIMLSATNSGSIFSAIFFIIIAIMMTYYIIKPVKSNILRLKYTFHAIYAIFLCFLIGLWTIFAINENIGFTNFSQIFSSLNHIFVLVYLIVSGISIIVIFITFLINPKLDKTKLKKAQQEFILYQQNIMQNFKNNQDFNKNNNGFGNKYFNNKKSEDDKKKDDEYNKDLKNLDKDNKKEDPKN